MSTRSHSLTICGQRSVISILQLPASASGYTRTPRLDLIPRVDMVVSKKKKRSAPLAGRKMRLHKLSKALFITTCADKPRFLFGSG